MNFFIEEKALSFHIISKKENKSFITLFYNSHHFTCFNHYPYFHQKKTKRLEDYFSLMRVFDRIKALKETRRNMKRNCIIGQSGGPTIAINASLAGIIHRAKHLKNLKMFMG